MTTNIQTFAGNVGIGTNDPGNFKLNVNGSVSATSFTVNGITNSEVPVGAIVIWYGTVANIPTGWTFCNGVEVARSDGSGNITPPDLKNKFVLCATADSPTEPFPGQTGGSHTFTLQESNLPSHTHTITVDDAGSHNHNASTGGAGGHSHGVYSFNSYRMGTFGPNQNTIGNFTGYRLDIAYAPYRTNTLGSPMYASSVGNHSHSVSVESAGSHNHTANASNTGSGSSFDNRPSYSVLAYIMKI